jgi:hypothetical protein
MWVYIKLYTNFIDTKLLKDNTFSRIGGCRCLMIKLSYACYMGADSWKCFIILQFISLSMFYHAPVFNYCVFVQYRKYNIIIEALLLNCCRSVFLNLIQLLYPLYLILWTGMASQLAFCFTTWWMDDKLWLGLKALHIALCRHSLCGLLGWSLLVVYLWISGRWPCCYQVSG